MAGYEITTYDELKDAVNEFGEVHAPLRDEEYEVELRRGNTIWNDEEEAVSVTKFGYTVASYQFGDFVNPYCPQEYKHRD